jgi:hypothetical protein
MLAMPLLLLVFVGILVVEWQRRSAVARTVALVLALIVLFFSQPVTGRAMRRAIGRPRAERVLELQNWGKLSDYASGVLTMQRAVQEDAALHGNYRLLSMGVLIWLTLSPAVRTGLAGLRHARDRASAA